MNPRPANDLDALVEQLSRLDACDPEDASNSQAPSTVWGLKAELDTLVGQLREPAEPDPFASESGLRRAQDLVLAIGVELESESKGRRELKKFGRIGPYELLEKLGEGGMGAVYKAMHTSLEKIVALKVLPYDRLSPQAISRFKREMKAVGKLDHPNVVRATDAGEADGNHFLVMEYVDGVDLSELTRRVGPLAAADACELVRQAAVGLQHAHQRGMVHRDIKPSNIMLAWSDEHAPTIKILDMGLALLSEPGTLAHGDLTTTGQLMGSLEYMSPEQSQDTHHVDIRADIYSLGATLYKLLCGKAPFSCERLNTPGKLMVALATETPPSLAERRADLPTDLIAIIDRMVARTPTERPATPAEVAKALAPFAVGADLTRLIRTARQQKTLSDKVTDKLMVSTEPFLSHSSTDTAQRDLASGVASAPRFSEDIVTTGGLTPPRSPLISQLHTLPAAEVLPVRRSSIPMQRVGLALVSALLMLLAAVVYRIQTDQGTLVVTIDDPAVQAILEPDGLVIRDKTSDRNWTIKATETKLLPSGKYQMEGKQNLQLLVTDDSGAEVTTDEFTLKRRGEVHMRVVVEQAASVAGNDSTDPGTSDTDRRAAEYVLSVGGGVVIDETQGYGDVHELPKTPFRLTAIEIHGSRQVSAAGLAACRGCEHLTRLQISQSAPVGDAGLEPFRECKKLKSLALSETGVTDAGLAYFSGRDLTGLSLHEHVTDIGLAHFKDCHNLETLGLAHVQMTVQGLDYFQECRNLWLLEISNSPLGDEAFVSLKSFPKLSRLSFVSEKLTNGGLVSLPDLKDLTFLSLAATQVDDAGVEQLKELTKLTRLYLVGTKVTPAGIAELKLRLPDCQIDWDGSTVEPRSTDPDRRAAEYVLSIGGQISFNGIDHWIGTVGDLPKGEFELTRVTLDPNPQLVSDTGLANFAGCRNLTYLYLRDAPISDAGLVYFKDCRNLTSLSLSGNDVSDLGLVHFADCRNLTSLELGGRHLTDVGMAHFKDCKQLTHLKLTWTNVSDRGLAHFRDCENLTSLLLFEMPVTDAGLAHFQNCQNLKSLSLFSRQLSDAGLVHFRNCKNLEFVQLSGMLAVGDAALENFRDCKNLSVLDLRNTGVSDVGLAHFQECTNFTSINLWDTNISDAGLELLTRHTKLRHLAVKGPSVTEAGVKKLSAALPECKIQWEETVQN